MIRCEDCGRETVRYEPGNWIFIGLCPDCAAADAPTEPPPPAEPPPTPDLTRPLDDQPQPPPEDL